MIRNPDPTPPGILTRMDLPHFEDATRRTFLRKGLSAAAILATGTWLTACGSSSDANTFAAASTENSNSASTVNQSGTVASSGSAITQAGATATTSIGSAALVASSGTATLAFTYTASDSSGRVKNPFTAAWVEDASSKMVALISVCFSARDAQYLRELTEYTAVVNSASATEVDAVTGATRSAGQYQFQWDGKGLDGSVLTGEHTVWVEAAREHGPHSVTNGKIVLGQAGSTTIPNSGELSNLVVTLG